MKTHRIIYAALVILALGPLTVKFAQDVSTQPGKSDQEHSVGIAILRSINTAELVYKQKYGSYTAWRVPLIRKSKIL